jgi:hypothetical protein
MEERESMSSNSRSEGVAAPNDTRFARLDAIGRYGFPFVVSLCSPRRGLGGWRFGGGFFDDAVSFGAPGRFLSLSGRTWPRRAAVSGGA